MTHPRIALKNWLRAPLRLLTVYILTMLVIPELVERPPAAAGVYPSKIESCTYRGHELFGRVQIVESFPDFRVQVVTSFPDLKVQQVDAFPDACGKWQFVESFPDFKVQFVESFPDFKIQFVESFPGIP